MRIVLYLKLSSFSDLAATSNLLVFLLQAGLVNPDRRVVDPLRLPLCRNFFVIPDAVPASVAAAAALGKVAPARQDLQAGERVLVGQVESCARRKRWKVREAHQSLTGRWY